jgi:hypothetical protein
MKKFVSSRYLSLALVAAAFAIAGSAPASAQALDRTGSMMPHHFTSTGELKWGSDQPQAEGQQTAQQQVTTPSRKLYLSAKRHASRAHAH